MRKRTIEMLQTLRKSSRKFSAGELGDFLEDLERAETGEVLAVWNAAVPEKAPRKRSATPKAVDPFVQRLDAARRKAGMKSKDGVDALNQIAQQLVAPVPKAKSFSAMIASLRKSLDEAALEARFKDAAAQFQQDYSTHYDLR